MSDVGTRCMNAMLRARHERARYALTRGVTIGSGDAAREDVRHVIAELRPGDLLRTGLRVVADADLLAVQAVVYRLGDDDAIAAIERLMFGVDAERPDGGG